ncbi:MAG: nucleotidyltransferase [Crocinitomicaceae bacterium]|nr:nucleotidyltransferase [Crocinitomicaceae bacterium]
MKIIVPMAGRGTRMRPHTLTTPKPLIPIAGKPIVQRLVEDIVSVCGQKVDEVAYIIGDFGQQVEQELLEIAKSQGAKGSIYHQDVALGTAHAILCAKESLEGPVVVAFADTLFRADFSLDTASDGVIWTKKVEDPRQFGVVQKNSEGVITDFVEKPQEFVSDEAIIGIYFFGDGANLRSELQYLIDNDIKDKGEYQITDALQNMKAKGKRFTSGTVNEWMDCGNKNITVDTNSKILEFVRDEEELQASDVVLENSTIHPPCHIAPGVVLRNSVVGPGVSIGQGSSLENVQVEHSIIGAESELGHVRLKQSMIGNKVRFDGRFTNVSIGDFSTLEK